MAPPYDGFGIYSPPAGTAAVSGATVASAKFNSVVADIQAALNDLRYSNLNVAATMKTFLGSADMGAARTNLGLGAAGNPQFATLELGNAADTTLARIAGGRASIEGKEIITTQSLPLAPVDQEQVRLNISAPLRGHIFGLTLTNNVSDATNDIDINPGFAASTEANPVLMTLSLGLTKRLDAAWAVGTGNGGLDTGSIANATYHVWLIQRGDTGVVDALFSLSATSPTMPSGYDRKRRIGSIIRASGAIRGFKQIGDTFLYDTMITDRNSTATAAVALFTLSVPTGIVVTPIINGSATATAAAANLQVIFGSANTGGINLYTLANITTASGGSAWNTPSQAIFTNTSAQIYFGATAISGAFSSNFLVTCGWIDPRGKDA